tara:strand:+ start:7459 stop:8061 length:603 start_codon:yes stop_codon:yes gene_type:complete
MKVGDYLQVLGEDGESWYAEVVGVKPDLEVYFIERTEENNGKVWGYTPEWYVIPPESVEIHITTTNVVDALEQLGFRAISDSTFIRIEDENSPDLVTAVPIDNVPDDDPLGIHPEMRDFIVPDEEGERFTQAIPNNDFVRETHEAVNAYNQWNPTEGEEKRVHDFIEQLDQRACTDESARGLESIPYTRPPTDYNHGSST